MHQPSADEQDERAGDSRETVHRLRDGGRILVRPLRASDRLELAAQYEELSPGARRLRFFNPPEHLTGPLLDYLVDLDGVDRFALTAWMIDEPGRPGVGVARYARDQADPSTAEAAVTVLDSYCNRGIGRILLTSLVAEARVRGITTFTGCVMWENQALLDSLRAYGAVVVPDEPGVAAVSVELPGESEELHGSALYRLLQNLAARWGSDHRAGEGDGV